jgi:hypothetical protein
VPFDSGLYFFFETGEESTHGPAGRIVRVGKNKENGRLNKRLSQHFVAEKNSSVFRKHLGGAFIRQHDPASPCLAPAPGKGHWEHQNDHKCPMCEPIERTVTEYLEKNTSFRCVRIDEPDPRSNLERILIATLAQCTLCVASPKWLGLHAYSERVKKAGLWNSYHTRSPTISEVELKRFESLSGTPSG